MFLRPPTVYDRPISATPAGGGLRRAFSAPARVFTGEISVTYVRNSPISTTSIIARCGRDGPPRRRDQRRDGALVSRGHGRPRRRSTHAHAARDGVHRRDGGDDRNAIRRGPMPRRMAEGHVLFAGSTAGRRAYGELFRVAPRRHRSRAPASMVAPYKATPIDFAPSVKPTTPDQPGWPSPWGRGRPAGHIECSPIGEGPSGRDLRHPRRRPADPDGFSASGRTSARKAAAPTATERMAQVVAGTTRCSRSRAKKMSKSLGNFFTCAGSPGPGRAGRGLIRFVMLGTHYRKPMDWTEKKRGRRAEATLEELALPSPEGRARGGRRPLAGCSRPSPTISTRPRPCRAMHRMARKGDALP